MFLIQDIYSTSDFVKSFQINERPKNLLTYTTFKLTDQQLQNQNGDIFLSLIFFQVISNTLTRLSKKEHPELLINILLKSHILMLFL